MIHTDATGQPTVRRWPTGTQYAEAVQQPTQSFSDPELVGGQLTLTPLGFPAMASGQNAVAFHFEAPTRQVAVRCLLSPNDDGRHRYQALQAHLASAPIPAVVPANWLDEGVRVDGTWWPVVVMPWATGRPLHDAVEDRLDDSERLIRLADRWFDLVESLQARAFAHGDLQHGNVLLTDDDEFQLIDLDGVWVPEISVGAPGEFGHPNYQHARRAGADWGPLVDTFSAIAIGVSMTALASDRSLARFMSGENLLFARNDFERVDNSPVWGALRASPDAEVRQLVGRLADFAGAPRPPELTLTAALAVDTTIVRSPLTAVPVSATGSGVLPSTQPAADDSWWDTSATGAAAVGAAPAVPQSHWDEPVDDPSSVYHVDDQLAAASLALSYVAAKATGLARVTGRPLVAGLVGGASAGLVGSVIAGVLQQMVEGDQANAALFVSMIAAFLGGFVNAWPSLNLRAYGSAAGRFLGGFGAGLIAGLIAVAIADIVVDAVLVDGSGTSVALVAYVWAVAAALVGFAVGVLRSPKAGAHAFTAGAIGGGLGGLVLGARNAEFVGGGLAIDGFDPVTMFLATAVAALLGLMIALALRRARSGSFVVIEGPGQGTTIDFHKRTASVGGSGSDTLALAGSGLPSAALRLRLTDEGATAIALIPVLVDGQQRADEFELRSGQVVAIGGAFVRVLFQNDSVAS